MIFGEVEIRNIKKNFSYEKEIYNKSSENNSENIEDDRLSILSIIVEAENEYEADDTGEEKFIEVLDLYSSYNRSALYKTGYLKNIDTKEIFIRKEKEPISLGIMFKSHPTWIPLMDFNDYLFIFIDCELKQCYLRFKHWQNKSRKEKDYQLKLIYLWFGLEAIVRLNEESIVPMLLKGAGFMIGNLGRYLTDEERKAILLKNEEEYEKAKKICGDVFERIRKERINIVHDAYKKWEYGKNIKYDYEILNIVSSRLDNYAKEALQRKITSKEEFLKEFPTLYKENENLINDLYGNVVFGVLNEQSFEESIVLEKYKK